MKVVQRSDKNEALIAIHGIATPFYRTPKHEIYTKTLTAIYLCEILI